MFGPRGPSLLSEEEAFKFTARPGGATRLGCSVACPARERPLPFSRAMHGSEEEGASCPQRASRADLRQARVEATSTLCHDSGEATKAADTPDVTPDHNLPSFSTRTPAAAIVPAHSQQAMPRFVDVSEHQAASSALFCTDPQM